jgi:hypothetical protein
MFGDTGNNRMLHFLKARAVVNVASSVVGDPVGLAARASLYGSGLAETKLGASVPLPTSLANREVVVDDYIKLTRHTFHPRKSIGYYPPRRPRARKASRAAWHITTLPLFLPLVGTARVRSPLCPAVANRAAAPSIPLAKTLATPTTDAVKCLTTSQPLVCVAIGATFRDIQFSGLAPGFAGVWQLNVKIPADAQTGTAFPVRVVTTGPYVSNLVTIAID